MPPASKTRLKNEEIVTASITNAVTKEVDADGKRGGSMPRKGAGPTSTMSSAIGLSLKGKANKSKTRPITISRVLSELYSCDPVERN